MPARLAVGKICSAFILTATSVAMAQARQGKHMHIDYLGRPEISCPCPESTACQVGRARAMLDKSSAVAKRLAAALETSPTRRFVHVPVSQ